MGDHPVQCQAMTLAWARCSRNATHVVGRRYWGDLATEYTHGHVVRRTWVDFHVTCAQHVNGFTFTNSSLFEQWEHVFGRVQFGASNGQKLGWVNVVTGEANIVPQQQFDIEAAGKARTWGDH